MIWRDVDGEQRLLMNTPIHPPPTVLHTTVRCVQKVASFPAMGPAWILEIIETLHTTCTAALAACVCTSEDDKKMEQGS